MDLAFEAILPEIKGFQGKLITTQDLHKDSPNTIVEFGISKEPEYVASSAIRDSEISDQDDLMDLPRPR
ncbi:hypothetical protein N7534_001213 [Penicillium rubens]|nr:hypothetical protein N7534_001213 [Penicillium rubens]